MPNRFPHMLPRSLHLLTLTWTLQHFFCPCKFEWHDGEYNNNVFLFWPKKITHISSMTVPVKYFRIVDSVVTSVWWVLEVQWMRFWLWPWRDPVAGTYCLSGHSLVEIYTFILPTCLFSVKLTMRHNSIQRLGTKIYAWFWRPI